MQSFIVACIAIVILTCAIAAILSFLKPQTIVDWGKAIAITYAVLAIITVAIAVLVIHYVNP